MNKLKIYFILNGRRVVLFTIAIGVLFIFLFIKNQESKNFIKRHEKFSSLNNENVVTVLSKSERYGISQSLSGNRSLLYGYDLILLLKDSKYEIDTIDTFIDVSKLSNLELKKIGNSKIGDTLIFRFNYDNINKGLLDLTD